jgi:hypothetical protein
LGGNKLLGWSIGCRIMQDDVVRDEGVVSLRTTGVVGCAGKYEILVIHNHKRECRNR